VDIEEVTEHPFIDLMESANQDDNQFQILELLFLFLDLVGNEFWHVLIGPMGAPKELWPLFPQKMKIVPDKAKYISHYEYTVWGEKHIIPPEQIVHFKNPNPADQYWGTGPLQAAVAAADLSIGMNTYENSLMKNRAQPDMALILPVDAGIPDEDQLKNIYGRWKQRFGGIKKTGKLAVLTGGADLKPLSLTPKEMNFLKGREATVTEIAAIFGVPLSKLTTKDVNLANAKVGEKQYASDTILPRLSKVEQRMNQKLISMYGESSIFVAFDNPVPDDNEFRLKERCENIRVGYSTINEERQIDGLEEAPWGDEPGPITTLGGGPQEPTNEPSENASRQVSYRAFDHRTRKSPLPPLEHPTNFVNEPFVAEMKRYLVWFGDRVIDGFDAEGEGLLSKCVSLRSTDPTITKSPLDDFLTSWVDLAEANTVLVERIQPFIKYTMLEGGRAAIRSVISGVEFYEFSGQFTSTLRNHTRTATTLINSNQVKRLRQTLAEGIEEGEAIPKLRKRITDKFGESVTRYEATRIARTETIWAWNEGAVQGYIQSGVVRKKQWLCANDERTCQWCPEMDGKIVEVEATFFNKGDGFEGSQGGLLTFDYEEIGHPPLHPQCRCTIIPVVEDF
jgi:HK97 family phage portal protein